jgi:type II secretion system protein G
VRILRNNAFTLIELLIVVLIIAILAAIAIPNFMEFQTRAKVSRVKNDMRSVATALEAYNVDEGTYPATHMILQGRAYYYLGLFRLTSPIAYIVNIPRDGFGEYETFGEKVEDLYEFGCGKAGKHYSGLETYPNDTWMLESAGPDGIEDTQSGYTDVYYTGTYPWVNIADNAERRRGLLALFYDPTNGTVSRGQIFRAGGAPPPETLVKMFYDLANR